MGLEAGLSWMRPEARGRQLGQRRTLYMENSRPPSATEQRQTRFRGHTETQFVLVKASRSCYTESEDFCGTTLISRPESSLKSLHCGGGSHLQLAAAEHKQFISLRWLRYQALPLASAEGQQAQPVEGFLSMGRFLGAMSKNPYSNSLLKPGLVELDTYTAMSHDSH